MTQFVPGTLVLGLGSRCVDQFIVQLPPPVVHYNSYSLYLVVWNVVTFKTTKLYSAAKRLIRSFRSFESDVYSRINIIIIIIIL